MQVRRATHLDYLGENGAEAKREGISLLLQQRVALHGTHELRLERGQGPRDRRLVLISASSHCAHSSGEDVETSALAGHRGTALRPLCTSEEVADNKCLTLTVSTVAFYTGTIGLLTHPDGVASLVPVSRKRNARCRRKEVLLAIRSTDSKGFRHAAGHLGTPEQDWVAGAC